MNILKINSLKKICFLAVLISVCSSGFGLKSSAAPWGVPEEELTAGAAAVMDVDSHTVLYGKEMNMQCYPASVTKLLTALIVAESCDLDEKVTVSETALLNMEQGAVVAYIKPGDEITVRDCLYGLLFRSANDIANVLAEHVSGSVEAFSELMNKRAEELGCKNSHFVNPSGLSSTEHLTTAYDMALIGAACMDNSILMELWKEDSYKMSGISEKPDGFRVTVGHKMLREDTEYYDKRVVGGKTGFTTASGNTLVTLAESNGRRIVTVCLQDKNPQHYIDTKLLLDFGFNYFANTDVSELIDLKALEERLINDKVIESGNNTLTTDRIPFVTLPNGVRARDNITWDYEYNVPGHEEANAVALISALYKGYRVGSCTLINDRESELSIEHTESNHKEEKTGSPKGLFIALFILAAIGGVTGFIAYSRNKENQRRLAAKERRRKRLQSMNVSEEEFEELLNKHREEKALRR